MPSFVKEALEAPLPKRQKYSVISDNQKSDIWRQSGSRVFAPFRTLGLVSPTNVPFTSVRLGKSTFQVTTSVGHSLHTYDLSRGLRLIFLSRPRTPELITATFAWKNLVFAAWGGLRSGKDAGVWIFRRGERVAALKMPPSLLEPIKQLLVFGSWIVGCCDKSIHVWKLGSHEHYATLTGSSPQMATKAQVFTGTICNMPTYVNKIFAGRADGYVDVWNVRSGRLLYSIPPSSPTEGPVTALQSTPVLSTLAIAYKSGIVSIYNVEFDRRILRLNDSASHKSRVTSISFRTDGIGAGRDGKDAGVMATSTADSGDIALWDLNQGGRKVGILRGAHEIKRSSGEGGINRIEFLDCQPVLISSGADNTLRSWIFDENPFSPIPRPLHTRQGHSESVTTLRFLPSSSESADAVGKWILSAAKDRALLALSLRKDSQNAELSQGNVRSKINKTWPGSASTEMGSSEDFKAPEIVALACSLNRDGGFGWRSSQPVWTNSRGVDENMPKTDQWESIVTAHRGDKWARTWFWGRKRAGRWAFETGDGTSVKSVAISPCGTFAVIGSEGGCIDLFNLQSGIHRKSFPSRPIPPKHPQPSPIQHIAPFIANGHQKASSIVPEEKHTSEVTGLAIDGLNRTLVSSGLDGKIKFWDFLSGRLVSEIDWSPMTAIISLRYSPQCELLAFGCDDLSIRIVDIETKKTVRELWGCNGQINDLTFSNDGRWVIATSMDSIIRVWDLPTGHLIDAFQTQSSCTALSFSENGQFLATAHAGEVGINIWTNKGLFVNIPISETSDTDVRTIDFSASSGELAAGAIDAAFVETGDEGDQKSYLIPSEQLDQKMVTLSSMPKNTWHTLLHLDTVRERNKPRKPPQKPEHVPFFLPSLHEKESLSLLASDGLTNDSSNLQVETTEALQSRISKLEVSRDASSRSARLSHLLKVASQEGAAQPVIDYLKSSSPSKVDLDIRSLDVRCIEGRCEMVDFIVVLTKTLQSRKDFELVNTLMAVFIRAHVDIVREAASCGNSAPPLSALKTSLLKWQNEQQREAERLSRLVSYCRGVAGFLRSAR